MASRRSDEPARERIGSASEPPDRAPDVDAFRGDERSAVEDGFCSAPGSASVPAAPSTTSAAAAAGRSDGDGASGRRSGAVWLRGFRAGPAFGAGSCSGWSSAEETGAGGAASSAAPPHPAIQSKAPNARTTVIRRRQRPTEPTLNERSLPTTRRRISSRRAPAPNPARSARSPDSADCSVNRRRSRSSSRWPRRSPC